MGILIPSEAALTEWIATANAIFRDELDRPPTLCFDPAGLASMLQIAASGGTAADMVAAVRSSPEWIALHAAAAPIAEPAPLLVAPREWSGNMCGVRVDGLPAVPGGAANPALVLSWFYDRYEPDARTIIRAAWKSRGYLDVLLSWPDSRAFEQSPQMFVGTCRELVADGFRPCVMLCSKDFDPPVTRDILAGLTDVLPLLVNEVPRVCIGWELSLWLAPKQVQDLIDAIAPRFTPSGCKVYVHFQEGYFAFSQEVGGRSVTADFWKLNVGKLTGILHQRELKSVTKGLTPQQEYQARLVDCLRRFSGEFGFPSDNGFGAPFDIIALEITAAPQFNGQMTETQGDAWGDVALATPPVRSVRVMGAGNGHSGGTA